MYIRNSVISAQTRWQKVLSRSTERRNELEKVFQATKKVIRKVEIDHHPVDFCYY